MFNFSMLDFSIIVVGRNYILKYGFWIFILSSHENFFYTFMQFTHFLNPMDRYSVYLDFI